MARWCWHRWTKWELIEITVKEAVVPYTASRQQSRCEKCGKYRIWRLSGT